MKKSFLTLRQLVLSGVFAALIAVGALIRIPLPLAPLTLQTLFVLLAGMLLGPRAGAFSVGVYLILGLAGLPVFAQGGGPGYLLQPTFGYLLGFVVCAWLVGRLTAKQKAPPFARMLCAGLAGLGAMYVIGVGYLLLISGVYLKQPVGLWQAAVYGFAVFLPGDLLSCAAAALLAGRIGAVGRP
ncbi:MAG: biotin transporter BioY [Clostridia bacterium]|nr:biotin transporter BioY [Clostridia bacterium]